MKILFFFLVPFLFSITISAQTFQFDSVNYKQKEIGVIALKNNTWVIRVDHTAFTEYFLPVNLPDKYQVNGQDIVFEGAIGKIPMDIKLEGTPIRLSMIRNLYKAELRGDEAEHISSEETDSMVESMADSVGYLQNQPGTIIKIGDAYLIEQLIDGEIKRFVPDALPDEFKKENARIYFSCVLRKIPANVRMMGAPVTIRNINFAD